MVRKKKSKKGRKIKEEQVDPYEVLLYLRHDTERGSHKRAAEKFNISPARVTQIVKGAQSALIKETAPAEAHIVMRSLEDRVDEYIKKLDHLHKMLGALAGQMTKEQDYKGAVVAINQMRMTVRDSIDALLKLEGRIGNMMVDARSITINTLPDEERNRIREEAMEEAAQFLYSVLQDDCKKKLREILGESK